jgi:hypothetical protein
VTALLPFLISLAHRYGWLKWVDPNWFSWRWLKYQYKKCVLGKLRRRVCCMPEQLCVLFITSGNAALVTLCAL